MSAPDTPSGTAENIYVIVPYYGSEGHCAPYEAFRNYDEAVAVARAMSRDSSVLVYAVPIWPATGDHWPDPVWGKK